MRNRFYKEESSQEKIASASHSLGRLARDIYLVTTTSAKYLTISEQRERLTKLIDMIERNLETIKESNKI